MSFGLCIHKRIKEFKLRKWKLYLWNSWQEEGQGHFFSWQCSSRFSPIKKKKSGKIFLCSGLLPMICLQQGTATRRVNNFNVVIDFISVNSSADWNFSQDTRNWESEFLNFEEVLDIHPIISTEKPMCIVLKFYWCALQKNIIAA